MTIKYYPSIQLEEHDPDSPESKRVLVYGWDADGLQKVRIKVDSNGNQIIKTEESTPTDPTRINGSFVFTRNASNYITSIAQTIDGTTYTKTITRDGSNYITGISVWV